jgi:hypothetical protein
MASCCKNRLWAKGHKVFYLRTWVFVIGRLSPVVWSRSWRLMRVATGMNLEFQWIIKSFRESFHVIAFKRGAFDGVMDRKIDVMGAICSQDRVSRCCQWPNFWCHSRTRVIAKIYIHESPCDREHENVATLLLYLVWPHLKYVPCRLVDSCEGLGESNTAMIALSQNWSARRYRSLPILLDSNKWQGRDFPIYETKKPPL